LVSNAAWSLPLPLSSGQGSGECLIASCMLKPSLTGLPGTCSMTALLGCLNVTHVAPELCREQGFVDGLALQPNGFTAKRQSEREQRELLLELTDMLRVAMAGNLRSVPLQDRTGKTVKGAPTSPRSVTASKHLLDQTLCAQRRQPDSILRALNMLDSSACAAHERLTGLGRSAILWRGSRFEVHGRKCSAACQRWKSPHCRGEPAGSEVLYNNSQPAGYAAEPVETVNYAGCHDGEIIFDQLIMKPADQVTLASTLTPTLTLTVIVDET